MRFSIIVPLYNKSYSLRRCVDSVLAQTYYNFELIVVDDGSTDDSLALLKEQYSSDIKSGLIKVFEQENQGVSSARNAGVNLALSSYLCFLDADDEWKVDFLERMCGLIADYPCADLYCLAHEVCRDGTLAKKPGHGLPDNHRGYVKDFFASSAKGSVAKSSKVCIRATSLLKIGCFPLGVVAGEDLYVWMRLALNGQVACDMSYSAIVHLEADNSRSARKDSVPYPFIYFSKNKIFAKPWSLNKYLFVIFYKHFFRSVLDLKPKEAVLHLLAYIKIYI